MTHETEDLIAEAKGIMGHNPLRNRQLEAEDGGRKHIKRLEPHAEAKPLVTLLKSATVQDVFSRYEENDACAGKAQAVYKRARILLLAPLSVAVAVGLVSFMIPIREIAHQLDRLGLARGDT